MATSASAAALTAKEVVVGTLTGKISLVTAAQWLWNTAMSANPIGVVIGLVAALAAGIGLLCVALDDGKSGQEQFSESSRALGESMADVVQYATDFQEGIQNAESRLGEFNDTLFASSEEQQALQDNMQEIQSAITEICKTASEERRDYTDQEIKQLDEYFQKLRDMADQELAIQEAKSAAIRQQAVTDSETFKGSLDEYKTTAQEWLATAQEQADAQIDLINSQTTTELVLLNQRYGDEAVMSNEAYAAEYEELMRQKDEKIALAQEEVTRVGEAYQQGYLERSTNMQSFFDSTKEYNDRVEEEDARSNERLTELKDELNQELLHLSRDNAQKVKSLRDQIKEEEDNHYKTLADLQSEYQGSLDENTKKELGNWLAMLAQTEMYGGEISDENKEFIDEFLEAYDGMDEEGKKSVDELMQGMLGGLEEQSPSLFQKAASIADGVIGTLNRMFGIASPSKVMKRIFKYVMEGAEEGFEDEEPKLLNQTAGIADDILKRFQLSKLDVSGMVQKMKAAVAAESYRTSASLSASGNYEVVRDSRYSSETDSSVSGGKYVAEIHVDLEGREVARATAPFMGEQLAWEG